MAIKTFYRKLHLLFILILLSGCVSRFNMGAIGVLKRFAKNQKEIDDYVRVQSEGFLRLQQDIGKGKLRKGLLKQEVFLKYGESIYCYHSYGETDKETCLYRHPLKFFSTDKVYLYFEEDNRLDAWELKLADK